MLHNPSGASSRTGGGDDSPAPDAGGALAGGRVQPIKPVALFSGIVQVGADGKVTVPFQIPSYRGQVRVMAVVAGATKIGHAEADVTVRDPLVVQATFPRFVTMNDEIQIPVFLTNMSGGPLSVNVKLDSVELPIAGLAPHKGGPAPIAFAGKDTGAVKIENGKSETLVFQAKATIPAGGATLRVVATAGNLRFSDTLDVPFLPAGPKDRVVQKLKLVPGRLDLATQAALKNWVPTSESTRFWITNNPYGESFQNLDYVIHYPFGCIEQTTSSTRPLLYIAGLAQQVDPQLAELQDRGHGARRHQPHLHDGDAVGRVRVLARRDRAARVGDRVRDRHAARCQEGRLRRSRRSLERSDRVDRGPRRRVRARREGHPRGVESLRRAGRGVLALRARARGQGPARRAS